MDRDLPDGFRWATAEECEAYSMCPSDYLDMIVVGRTVDADGNRYTGGESDLAVPNDADYFCGGCGRPELDCSKEPCPAVEADREAVMPDPTAVTKRTAELAIDDVFASGRDDREFEVWTTPVETDTSNGRLAFMAKDMTTNDILEHQAQATWLWEIR
jgi:hypothetical protein